MHPLEKRGLKDEGPRTGLGFALIQTSADPSRPMLPAAFDGFAELFFHQGGGMGSE